MECDWRFREVKGQCIHYIWPPDQFTIIGSVLLFFIAGVSSIAGLGGGGPSLVVLLLAFNYNIKDSTIMVFACIVGATLGSTLSQMRKSLNGQPLIKYQYAFVSIPLMLAGAFFGVMINKILPSLVTCIFILIMIALPMKNILTKFIEGYKKESQQNLNLNRQHIHQETINPFSQTRNLYIFFNVFVLISVYIFLETIRGSQRFHSIVHIKLFTYPFWILYAISLSITILFAVLNYQSLKYWLQVQSQPNQQLEIHPTQNKIEQHKASFILNSILGGMFSGFGFGGGTVVVPMYRDLGMSPLQATSTCAFGVFVTAIINCFQGVFFGIIKIDDLVYLITVSGVGSFILSKLISSYLQKINRLSIVELMLFLLLLFSVINIPFSLWSKYQRSGYNLNIILGFGTFD